MKGEQEVSWLCFRKVDLGKGYSLMLAHAIVDKASAGGRIDVRLDGPEGALIGRIELRENATRDAFDYLPASLQAASGVHDVYLVCTAKPGVLIRQMILLGAHDEKSPVSKTDGGFVLRMQDCAFKKGAHFADGALGGISPGTWLYFPKVDFGASCSQAFVNLSVPHPNAGGVIELRSGSIDGKLLGRHVVTGTGSWDKNFEDQRVTLQDARGVQDVFVVFNAYGVANIRSIRFPSE
jgi:hypothetical protein